MFKFLKNLYLRITGKDRCFHCSYELEEDGYCSPCNKFPYKKWITDAEDLWMSEVDFMRANPEEYARQEQELADLWRTRKIYIDITDRLMPIDEEAEKEASRIARKNHKNLKSEPL